MNLTRDKVAGPCFLTPTNHAVAVGCVQDAIAFRAFEKHNILTTGTDHFEVWEHAYGHPWSLPADARARQQAPHLLVLTAAAPDIHSVVRSYYRPVWCVQWGQ
jgi:hypothetical protein